MACCDAKLHDFTIRYVKSGVHGRSGCRTGVAAATRTHGDIAAVVLPGRRGAAGAHIHWKLRISLGRRQLGKVSGEYVLGHL